MSNTVLRQNKLQRLIMEPEATLGTAETFDASSLVIPAENISVSPDRGTRIIDRTSLLDGYAGDVSGSVGTWGWSMSFDAFVHDCGNTQNQLTGYWPRLLGSCGFKAVDDGSEIVFSPTTAEIDDFSPGATTNPFGCSFGHFHNNNGTSDTVQFVRGATGVANFSLTTGEDMMINCSYVGLVSGGELIHTGTVDTSATGSYTQMQTPRFNVKNLTCTFTDNLTSTGVTVTALNDVTINSGAETPEVQEACGSGNYGFAVSPVFWNTSPTVSFTIADTDAVDDYFFQRLFTGDTFSIEVTATAPSGNEITFSMPNVQFQNVSLGETNGYSTYQIEGKCVRLAGDGTDDALMQVVYTYS